MVYSKGFYNKITKKVISVKTLLFRFLIYL